MKTPNAERPNNNQAIFKEVLAVCNENIPKKEKIRHFVECFGLTDEEARAILSAKDDTIAINTVIDKVFGCEPFDGKKRYP